ncbi:hypothetical protein H257_13024 [Aphanomyces astaci]|uniref:Uncharacterized protein n=1 Tax=Aphanomyces astaci TaxID=112090 RepID=W4FYY5_APHAT|nr:hypothetical protein H257_13024 [Aphanomyces astaci]ETV71893.1 hypothetical protein H257_13024 [Aphanomyces astaci]|eukprot:XP_009838742.1 hypothetical protein H257_13024 [Aphanomyces astaci]
MAGSNPSLPICHILAHTVAIHAGGGAAINLQVTFQLGDQKPFGDRDDEPAVAFRITFNCSVDHLEGFAADNVNALNAGLEDESNIIVVFKPDKGEVYAASWSDAILQVDVCHLEDDEDDVNEGDPSRGAVYSHCGPRESTIWLHERQHSYEFGPLAVVQLEPDQLESEVDEGEPSILLRSDAALANVVMCAESLEIARDYNVHYVIEWLEDQKCLPHGTSYVIAAVDATGATIEAPFFPLFAYR